MTAPRADSDLPANTIPLSYESADQKPSVKGPLAHPYTVAAIILFASMAIAAVLKHNSEWVATYLGAAKALLGGQDMYYEPFGLKYTYPPFSAWLMLPFTLLPLPLARFIWFSINAVATIYLIKTAWRLSGGTQIEPITSPRSAGPRDQIAFIIGHVIALQLTLNCLTHLQTDVLIAALLIAGCTAIVGGRYFRAATWIGVAAAFKATPLLFAPYLLWRKQWLAATWLVIVAITANLLPNTVHSAPGGGIWLVQWYHQYLQPMVKPGYVPGDWQNLLDNNQALAGAANRWLKTSWRTSDTGDLMDRPNHVSPRFIRNFFITSCLFVTLPVAFAFWKKRGAVPPVPSPRESDFGALSRVAALFPNPIVLECGMIMLLMALLSPNSSRAHFCVMYLAAFCVARVAVRPNASIWIRILLCAAVISSTLSIHIRLPGSKNAEQILLWVGVVMFATIFLLFAGIATLLEYKKAEPGQDRDGSATLEPAHEYKPRQI